MLIVFNWPLLLTMMSLVLAPTAKTQGTSADTDDEATTTTTTTVATNTTSKMKRAYYIIDQQWLSLYAVA